MCEYSSDCILQMASDVSRDERVILVSLLQGFPQPLPNYICCCQYIFLLETNLSLSLALKPLNSQLLPTGVIPNSFDRHKRPFTIWPQSNSLLFFLVTVILCPAFSLQYISYHFLKEQCPSVCLYPNCSFCLKMLFARYHLIKSHGSIPCS